MREFQLTASGRRLVIGGAGAWARTNRAELARLVQQAAQQDLHTRRALASWYVCNGGCGVSGGPEVDEHRLVERLVEEIRAGSMRVRESPSFPESPYSHQYPSTISHPEPARFESDAPEIVDELRLLEITRCDPRLDDDGLEFTFAIRGLEGQTTWLRVVSDNFPGKVVHERPLDLRETADGLHPTTWDGVVTTSGDYEGKLLPPQFSPARIEVVHNDELRDQASFTISAIVHVVELEDVVFATGCAILLPDGWIDQLGDTSPLTGLDAVAAVLRHAAFHEEATLAIFGHTDTVGSASSNLELSLHRATNALHVITGDADAWAAHCDQHYKVADFQKVLAWIARTRGWDTDPGKIDGQFGAVTRTARANFRDQMNAEYGTSLKQGVKQSIGDWKAYFTLYNEELARLLEWSPEDLQRVRDQLRLAEPAAIGCGEAFPADGVGQNNLASATNRRVDFVFFDPDELPELPGDPPGYELYGTVAYRAKYLPLGPSIVTVPIRVRLTRKQKPLVGVDYTIEQAGAIIAQSQTDANGYLTAEVPKDAQDLSLRVPEFGVVYGLEVGKLRPLATLAGVQDRLANLGYYCSRSGVMDQQTVEALKAFQFVQGLEVTGAVDDDTITRLRAEHRS